MKNIILSVFCLFFVLMSCKKELLVPNNGIYRGVFREIYNETDTIASGVVYLALWESSQKFEVVGDSLTNAPASHRGLFFIQDASRIVFTNKSVEEAQYDSDHYLDTLYNYRFDDEIFEFSFQDGATLYEYNLARD